MSTCKCWRHRRSWSDTYVKVDRASLVASITAGANVQFCCTSGITDMSYLINDATFDRNIGGWDTSSVTTMEGMFEGQTILIKI